MSLLNEEEHMTTVRDYLDSIRQSLDRIADSNDLDLEPGGIFRRALETLDAQASMIARAWGDPVKKETDQ